MEIKFRFDTGDKVSFFGKEYIVVNREYSKKKGRVYDLKCVKSGKIINEIMEPDISSSWQSKIQKEPIQETLKKIEMEKAERHNTGKLRWSLVDFDSLEDMIKVLEFGANKYSDNNWKKGLKTTEICDSLLRHLTAYLKGEDKDQESGLEHTGHILCNAMFLAYMMKNKPEFDSRNK